MSNPSYSKLLQPTGLALETFLSARDVVGPASYVPSTGAAGGHMVSAALFGLGSLRLAWSGGLTASGTYYVRTQMKRGSGFNQVKLVWYVAATNAEVAAGTNLGAEFIPVVVIGK